MSVRTKKPRIRKKQNRSIKLAKEKKVSWRKAAKDDIEKYSEGGLMLRGCRYKAELTQKELADEVKISQHHISEMENGKRPIGKIIAKRFANFFGVDYRIFL